MSEPMTLLPCPFCGATDAEVYPRDRSNSAWNVCCGNPRCVTRGDNDYLTESDAIAQVVGCIEDQDAEIARLQSDLRDGDDLRERLTGLLIAIANALKGDPSPNCLHSWHDLAEMAATFVTERDALRSRIEEAPKFNVLGKHGDHESFTCWVSEDMVGKRVALVVVE